MELHHIKPESEEGDDTYENCMPLCFDCHAEVQHYNPNHPKGRKFSEGELRGHRDRWYHKVKESGGIAVSSDHIDMDRKLFAEIRELLPSTGSIDLVRNNDYVGSFNGDEHEDFEKFLSYCDRPEVEFMDSDLESLRVKLAESINTFTWSIANNVYPTRSPGYYSVPSEWAYEQPSRYREAGEQIHKTKQEVCRAYDELIRQGRRKLGVS
jgi:hypothetical protein